MQQTASIKINDFGVFVAEHIVNIGTPYVFLTNNMLSSGPGVSDWFTERFLFTNDYLDALRIGYTGLITSGFIGSVDIQYMPSFTLENAKSQFRAYLYERYKGSEEKEFPFGRINFIQFDKNIFFHAILNEGGKILNQLAIIKRQTTLESLKIYIGRIEKVHGLLKFERITDK